MGPPTTLQLCLFVCATPLHSLLDKGYSGWDPCHVVIAVEPLFQAVKQQKDQHHDFSVLLISRSSSSSLSLSSLFLLYFSLFEFVPSYEKEEEPSYEKEEEDNDGEYEWVGVGVGVVLAVAVAVASTVNNKVVSVWP